MSLKCRTSLRGFDDGLTGSIGARSNALTPYPYKANKPVKARPDPSSVSVLTYPSTLYSYFGDSCVQQ